MAKYRITAPDGKTFEVEGEGSQEEALAHFQATYKPKFAAQSGLENTLAEMGPLDKFNAGVGGAFTRLGQAGKQIVGMGTDYAQEKDAANALNKTGPGMAGNIAGNVAAFAPLALVPGANTIAGAGALGAITGAFQPTDTDAERLKNMGVGGALGSMAQTVAKYPNEIWDAVKGVGRGAKAMVEPLYQEGRQQILARALRDASGGNPDVAARLAAAKELVPGSAPTAAEVAGSPGIAAMQRTASATNPEAYGTRVAQQNEARVAELQDLAGSAGRRQAFENIRNEGADEMYKAARALGIDESLITSGRKGEITKLLNTPAIQKAVEEAKVLAQNEMQKVGNPAGSVKGLDYVKRALDDQIGKAQGNEQRVLVALKDRLLTTLDTLSPAYGAARSSYAEMSKPITQMNVMQEIAGKSIRPIDNVIQPGQYARALRDETAQGVTGMRNATLENTLEPQQLSRLTALKDDLARSVAARDMGRGAGSDTVQKLAMSNLLRRSGLPESVLQVPMAGRLGNWAYESADNKMRQQLAETLLDPKAAAQLLGKAGPMPMPTPTDPALGNRAAMLSRMLMLPSVATGAGK